MLVPDNPPFGPPPSEVTPNDSDNAKAVIFKRRNAFSYVRPPYSSSCSPSSRASSKSCLRIEAYVASINRCRLPRAILEQNVPVLLHTRYGSVTSENLAGPRYGFIGIENLADSKRPAIKVLFLAPTPFRVSNWTRTRSWVQAASSRGRQ